MKPQQIKIMKDDEKVKDEQQAQRGAFAKVLHRIFVHNIALKGLAVVMAFAAWLLFSVF